MKNALLIIGNSIKYNDILIDYISREVKTYLKKIDFTYMIDDEDKELFLLIEDILNKCDEVVLVTDEKNFNITGKILSTIHNDTLILKNGMLLPSKSSIYDTYSYLLENGKNSVNVLQIKPNKKLPKILIKEKQDIKFINIFDIDKESCQIVLAPIAENFDIKIKIVEIIDNWNFIKLESLKYGHLNNFIDAAIQLLPDKIIPQEDLFLYITFKLIENKIKISTAESCTGGLLSSTFIKYSGVSSIINGNLVTYANKTKEAWLGVNKKILQDYGAVSKECVEEMLKGALNVSDSDISIAISGVAGPTGGTYDKPVGTIYIGVRDKKQRQIIRKYHLMGDRNYIQSQTVLHAVKLLLEFKKEIFFPKFKKTLDK